MTNEQIYKLFYSQKKYMKFPEFLAALERGEFSKEVAKYVKS